MDILNFISWIKGGKNVKTVDPTKTLVPLGVKSNRRDDNYIPVSMTVEDLLALGGGGLQGESYIVVLGNNPDPVVNGAELKAAYDVALAATPYGNPRNIGNEFSIIIGPGTYDMRAYNGTYGWELTGDYINMISLTGEPDVVISTFCVIGGRGTYKGLNTADAPSVGLGTTGQILMGNLSTNGITAYFENCTAGPYSFGAGLSITGSFKNCTAGNYSFGTTLLSVPPGYILPPQSTMVLNGGYPLVVGSTFENCTAGNYSFGSSTAPNAFLQIQTTFRNCKSGGNSFGFSNNSVYIFDSTFTDCTAIGSGFCFGASNNGNLSSTININSRTTFTNCKAISFSGPSGRSFGNMAGAPGSGTVSLSGTFINCLAGNQSFGFALNSIILSGKFIDCEAGDESFGHNPVTLANANVSGTFTNCIAGQRCFGSFTSGIFTNCKSGKPGFTGGVAFGVSFDGSSQDAAGTFISCISTGNTAFGATFSGTPNATGSFYNCVSSGDSFGNMDLPATSNLTGRALYCHKTSGLFYTSPGGTARAVLCINSALTVQTI